MRRDVQDGDGGPPAQVSKLRGWLAEGGGMWAVLHHCRSRVYVHKSEPVCTRRGLGCKRAPGAETVEEVVTAGVFSMAAAVVKRGAFFLARQSAAYGGQQACRRPGGGGTCLFSRWSLQPWAPQQRAPAVASTADSSGQKQQSGNGQYGPWQNTMVCAYILGGKRRWKGVGG